MSANGTNPDKEVETNESCGQRSKMSHDGNQEIEL